MARRSYTKLYGLLCLALIVCGILYYLRRTEGFQATPTMDLVVARYEEDISWVKNIPEDLYTRMIIYNKGTDAEFDLPKSQVIPLPNFGREGHTYLTHIVNNYDNLPDITFFVPGSSKTNQEKMRRVMKIAEYLKENRTSIILGHKDIQTIDEANTFKIDEWKSTSMENANKNPESTIQASTDRPLKVWFEKRFNGDSINCVSFLGIVAVSREDIRKRPAEFYYNLSQEMLSTNPETGHYIERVWKHILSIDDDKCLPV